MIKHTPGPWQTSYYGRCTKILGDLRGRLDVQKNAVLAEVRSFGPHGLRTTEAEQDEIDANGELMARAPELLEENTTLRARVEELESKLSFALKVSESRTQELTAQVMQVQELEATCAAQREALEAYEKVEIEREKCRAGRAHINAALKWDRLRKKALSPTAGRDYRDAVLEEAAKMFEGSSRGVILLGHQAAAYIRLLKRGGK